MHNDTFWHVWLFFKNGGEAIIVVKFSAFLCPILLFFVSMQYNAEFHTISSRSAVCAKLAQSNVVIVVSKRQNY